MRNNLVKYNFHFDDGNVASWKDIQQLYEIDSKNEIRCCPKLTHSHLFPNNFQEMKVKLATQVLSHTVSSAFSTGVSTGQLPPRAAAAAELVEKFDRIFDSLKSSSPESPKHFNKPISQDSGHCEFMEETSCFVKNIKVIDPSNGKDVTNNLKCLDRAVATGGGGDTPPQKFCSRQNCYKAGRQNVFHAYNYHWYYFYSEIKNKRKFNLWVF